MNVSWVAYWVSMAVMLYGVGLVFQHLWSLHRLDWWQFPFRGHEWHGLWLALAGGSAFMRVRGRRLGR